MNQTSHVLPSAHWSSKNSRCIQDAKRNNTNCILTIQRKIITATSKLIIKVLIKNRSSECDRWKGRKFWFETIQLSDNVKTFTKVLDRRCMPSLNEKMFNFCVSIYCIMLNINIQGLKNQPAEPSITFIQDDSVHKIKTVWIFYAMLAKFRVHPIVFSYIRLDAVFFFNWIVYQRILKNN